MSDKGLVEVLRMADHKVVSRRCSAYRLIGRVGEISPESQRIHFYQILPLRYNATDPLPFALETAEYNLISKESIGTWRSNHARRAINMPRIEQRVLRES